MDELDKRDQALIGQLRDAFRADAVPSRVTDAAKAALSWRRVDAELAELLSDSALDAEPTLARGGAPLVRSVGFSAGGVIIDLEIQHDGERRVLLGQLSPAAQRTVAVQRADAAESATTRSDELGRFRIGLEDGGTVRLRIADDSGAAIETAWIPI
jgi:hypothetical protein